MLIDLRTLYSQSGTTSMLLPHIEMQIAYLALTINFNATFDALSGFDFLQTVVKDRKFFGITTILDIFTLNRAPMG